MPAPRRILLVEDDDDTRLLVQELLEDGGYQVEPAKDGTQAAAAAARHKPSLVVLDFYLPDEDGNDVLARLNAAYRPVPVIVISGAQRIEVPGVVAWVNKPFHRETLLDVVGKHFPQK